MRQVLVYINMHVIYSIFIRNTRHMHRHIAMCAPGSHTRAHSAHECCCLGVVCKRGECAHKTRAVIVRLRATRARAHCFCGRPKPKRRTRAEPFAGRARAHSQRTRAHIYITLFSVTTIICTTLCVYFHCAHARTHTAMYVCTLCMHDGVCTRVYFE